MSVVRVADLFCGAGGSSSGARRALAAMGHRMDLVAVNHWPVAIATHSRNHPEARHYCQDINAAKPAELVPEGKLDLLMASPTCTYHSRARGGKPINDQGRMDPWAVIHWCTELRVKRLIVENVPEFVDWGPINLVTGRPIKRRRGEYFRAWIGALQGAGFRVEWRILNAADFGDATTRERFFLLARSDGRRISWPRPTHSRSGMGDIELGPMQRWRAARDIIDWSIEGRSIFDRKRPLSPKTLARIHAGAIKFRWPTPFLVILRNHMDAQSLDDPVPTLCAGGTHIGLAEPFLFGNRENNTGKPLDGPIPGMTTAHGGGIALAEPVAFTLSNSTNGAPRSIDDPLMTITTGGASNTRRPGCARPAVVEPFILNRHGDNGGDPRGVGQPLPTITTGGNGSALIAPYYSSGSGETCRTVATPLPTVTTKARFGLVVPVTNSCGGPGPRSTEQPLPTMTTAKGGEFALVMPVTHGDDVGRVRSLDDPLPTVTGANRGELAFITGSFGERDGQAPRVRSVDQPAPAICAHGYVPLVEGFADGRQYDIRFRMLGPKELARAMGFSNDEIAYEFVGTKTEITKQIGNAVPVATAAALVEALFR